MSSSSLDDLPSELLVHIFTFLPSKSVISCLRVNRRFNRIIEENRKLMDRKNMDLDITGSEENQTIIKLELSASYEPLQLVCAGQSEAVHSEEQEALIIIEYLNNYRKYIEEKTDQPSLTIQTNDLENSLRRLLTFIMTRINFSELMMSSPTPQEAKIIAEVLSNSRCSISRLNLCCSKSLVSPLNDGLSRILECTGDGLQMSTISYCDPQILDVDSVKKLRFIDISFIFNPDDSEVYIGRYVTKLQGINIRITRCWYILKEDLALIIQQWSLGLRTIQFYYFLVKTPQNLDEYMRNLPFVTVKAGRQIYIILNRSIDLANLSVYCKPQDQEGMFSVALEET